MSRTLGHFVYDPNTMGAPTFEIVGSIGTLSFTKTDPGVFVCTDTGAFPMGQTFGFLSANAPKMTVEGNGDNLIVQTWNADMSETVDVGFDMLLEVVVI